MTTRRPATRLNLAWLAVITIIVVTAVPAGVRPPVTRWLWTGFETTDIVRNLLLFLPLGFFRPASSIVSTACVAVTLSMGVELLQMFSPGRYAALGDVISNTVGAIAGAGLTRLLGIGTGAVTVRRYHGVVGLVLASTFPVLYPPMFIWIRVRYGNAHPLFELGAPTECASLGFFIMFCLLAVAATDRVRIRLLLLVLTIGLTVPMVGAVTFFGSTVAERAAGAAIGAVLAWSVLRRVVPADDRLSAPAAVPA